VNVDPCPTWLSTQEAASIDARRALSLGRAA